jgi:hypothetical protein
VAQDATGKPKIFKRNYMRRTNTILTKVLFWSFITTLMAAVPLNAQAFKFRFGSQLSLVNPAGNLSDRAKSGIGADLSFEFCFGNQFAIRENIGYVIFGQKTVSYNDYWGTSDVKHTTVGIGGFTEFIFRSKSHDKGVFGFVGLGNFIFAMGTKNRYDNESNSDFIIAASAGIGHKFNRNWGFEIRYTKSLTPVDYYDYYGLWNSRFESFRFDWTQVSLIQRF